MVGWDIFVSRVLTKGEIMRALATALGIKQDKILIVKSINGVEHLDKNTLVLCQAFLCKNHDFPLRIDTYIRDEQVIYEKLVTIEQLSMLLQCNILIGDETLNPVSFWLYLYKNGRERITVSASMLDEQNMEEVNLAEDSHIVSSNNAFLKRSEE